MPEDSSQNPPRLRKTLWLCASAWLLFLATLFGGNFFIEKQKAITRSGIGHDFLAFYTAGHFLRTGQLDHIYDLDATRAFQESTARAAGLDWDDSPGMLAPFWNPPYYALPFVPLSALPFHWALLTWWIINIACLVASLFILAALLPPTTRTSDKILLALVLLASMPAIQAFTHAQNTYTSLLLVTSTVYLWRKAALTRNPSTAFLAGLVCGLLAYKPQLGAVLGGIMALTLGWRALLGGAITVTLCLLATLLVTPGLLSQYLHNVGPNLHWMQAEQSYLWERHATLKAFWRLLIQHHAIGETSPTVVALWSISALGLAAALVSLVYRYQRRIPAIGIPSEAAEDAARQLDRLIAATILAMPLLMPFYFDYDLLLLAVPATLLAGDMSTDMLAGATQRRGDRWLIASWFILYAALVISPLASGALRVHIGVIALTSTALLHVGRACRRENVTLVRLDAPQQPMAAAA